MSWPRMKSHRLRVRHGLLLRQKNLQTCENIFKSFFSAATQTTLLTLVTPFHHILPDLIAYTYFFHLFLLILFHSLLFYFQTKKSRLLCTFCTCSEAQTFIGWNEGQRQMAQCLSSQGSEFTVQMITINPCSRQCPLWFLHPRRFFITYGFKRGLITISTPLTLAGSMSNEQYVQTAAVLPQGRTQLSLSLNGTQWTMCVRVCARARLRVWVRVRNNQWF